MSKHVVQCLRGHHYNSKFNLQCPRCGERQRFGTEEPATPEQLQRLKEHFNA